MKILLILVLYVTSGRVLCADVTGYVGGSVLINCKYDHWRYMNHTKYFCKLKGGHECTQKVLSNAQSGTSHEGRFIFMDIKDPGLFSVLIKNISQGDDGTYRCGVEDKGAATTLTLDVTEDSCCGTSQVHTLPPGGNVTFTCVYPERIKAHFKYVHKATDRSYRTVVYALGQSGQEGRFSLSDHPQENLFNVTLSDVTEEDEGVYLCGAQQQGSVNTYISFFNEMQLQVTAPVTAGSTVIIAVCVCVALLVTGGLVLTFYGLRYKKTQGSSSSTSNRRNTENDDEVQHVPYYEEIPDSQFNTNTVYSTTQKPRAPDSAASRTAVPPSVLPDRDFYTMAHLSNADTVSHVDYATVDLH